MESVKCTLQPENWTLGLLIDCAPFDRAKFDRNDQTFLLRNHQFVFDMLLERPGTQLDPNYRSEEQCQFNVRKYLFVPFPAQTYDWRTT